MGGYLCWKAKRIYFERMVNWGGANICAERGQCADSCWVGSRNLCLKCNMEENIGCRGNSALS